MISFYKKLFLFLLPILLVLIILPVDERAKYIGLEEDCSNKGIWLYDRIFEQEKPIDCAFVGSSHTINSVMDEYIEEELKEKNIKVANLGYCRLGRNLAYTIAKNAIEQKGIKTLIVEVREDEDRQSHNVFPHMANTKDVLTSTPLYNGDLISDYYQHLSYKLEIRKEQLFATQKVVPISQEPFGFGASSDTTSIEELEKHQKRQESRKALTPFARNYFMKFARTHLQKISEDCKANNIKLYFLYIPSYGAVLEKPLEFETYKQYGEVLLPPISIFKNTNYWKDKGHLNEAGAKVLSEWLAIELKQIL
jgi:hypothetical protein